MEGRDLAWLQTLKHSIIYAIEVLIKHFIKAYSKIETKHNTIYLIVGFKQIEKESVIESISKL